MAGDEPGNDDEFGDLKQTAESAGIAWGGQPHVKRRSVLLESGHRLSALVWGLGEPELVLLHGNGQNAHTWDSLALALDRPLIAFDLPGHGYSDWREDADYRPVVLAGSIADAMAQLALRPAAVVGVSLGGLTTIRLAATAPELVRRAMVIDVTPSTGARIAAMSVAERGASSLTTGPLVFDSFDSLLEATAAAVPDRPLESLKLGLRHNARALPDGRWAWRYDRVKANGTQPTGRPSLWDDLSATAMPIMLVRGAASQHVPDDDRDEFRRRRPDARFEDVEGADHSVPADQPVELAELISDFVTTT